MIALLSLTLPFLFFWQDPAPGLFRSKAESRNLDCERMSQEEANRQIPGAVALPPVRGDFMDRNVMVCRERVMEVGLRGAQDEAILSSLRRRASALAALAASVRPDLNPRTWLVEAHYPDPQVAAKITFATKDALVGQGLAVSDRLPSLAVDDVEILTRMPPEQSYPAACGRYFANGSLGSGDALLAVLVQDSRETILHAGLCAEGQWTWLR